MAKRIGGVGFLLAMVAVAANLRPAISSVPPLLEVIRRDLGLSHAAVGLITTIPVLLMGLVPVLAAYLAARAGSERLVLAAVLVVGVGLLARLIETVPFLYLSAALIGLGIATAQTLLPDLAKSHFRERAATVMAVQAVAMTVGAGLAAVVTPSLAAAGSWPLALAIWALPAFAGAAIWRFTASLPAPVAAVAAPAFGFPLRSVLAWRITLFAAVSSALFYTTLTWIPPTYTEAGWSTEETGTLLLVLSLSQLAASLAVTGFSGAFRDRRPQLVGSLVLGAAGCAGLAWAPMAAPWGWMLCVGLATGALFPLSLMLPVDYEERPEALRCLSAMSLTGSYVLAATGPVLFGALRGATGDYAVAYAALGVCCLASVFMSMRFAPRAWDLEADAAQP
ncbi:MAG: MFS transporter [Alphaproteobacteria bacterium]|nr:MFS transporter [Alphaproteobacteria bacterium]